MKRLKIGCIIIYLLVLLPQLFVNLYALGGPNATDLLKIEKARIIEELALETEPYQRSIESRLVDPEKLANFVSYRDAPFPIDELLSIVHPRIEEQEVTTFSLVINRLVFVIIMLLGLAGVLFIFAAKRKES